MFGFIWGHFFSDFQAPDVDLTGKRAIVTGSNVGKSQNQLYSEPNLLDLTLICWITTQV